MVVLVHEQDVRPTRYERLRSFLAAPWRVVRREKHVRRFLIANTAWEATFAGMRTFVVLYIIDGLDQPLYVSSTVLGVVAAGYVLAALAAGRFGDEFGVGNVILGASVVYGLGLLVRRFRADLALVVLRADLRRSRWRAASVMTLAWALLFKVMPATDRGTITGLATTTKGLGLVIGPARRRRRDRHLPPLLPVDGRLRGHLAGRGDPGAGRHPARRSRSRRPRASSEAGRRVGLMRPKPQTLSRKT